LDEGVRIVKQRKRRRQPTKVTIAKRVIRNAKKSGALQSDVTQALAKSREKYLHPRQAAYEAVMMLLEAGLIRRQSAAMDGAVPPGKAGWRLFWVG